VNFPFVRGLVWGHTSPRFPLTKKEINMDTFAYLLLAFGAFSTTFIMGWQFGVWMQSLDERKEIRDLYANDNEDFHNVYYTDNKCKYTACCKSKGKKAKKASKKKEA